MAALRGLADDSRFVLREHLDARLGGTRLWTRVGWLDFSEDELLHVRAAMDGQELTPQSSGRALVERLVRSGVLVPVGT